MHYVVKFIVSGNNCIHSSISRLNYQLSRAATWPVAAVVVLRSKSVRLDVVMLSLLNGRNAVVTLCFFGICYSRTSTYGSEAARSLYSGGQQQEDEFLSNRQNPMMMTMKKPMHASSRRPASPPTR